MKDSRSLATGLLILLAMPSDLRAQAQPALSPRNANYTIEVTLNPEKKILEGREVISWRNDRDRPAKELWFHLYYNAWKNTRSTWLLERKLVGQLVRRHPKRKIREEDWGYIDVTSVKLLGVGNVHAADLTSAKRFASPDDGNPDDRTVMVVPLTEAVAPGDSVRVELSFICKIPRTFSRTGYRGDYFFIAQWFPKLGVYENGGTWNCHQFHTSTEFFSDFGIYDVKITAPSNFVVGATGRLVQKTDNPDGTSTHRHLQEDVHDFAWTASPDFVVQEEQFEHPGLPSVEMRLMLQPEHLGQAERHFAATRAALQYYGTWYGAYPYGHVTVVDPVYLSGSGGMEYPTFFTCGTRLLNPEGGGSPEGVTIHECGHQFWYGIVGNNEFQHAWIDEGLNTFSDARVMEAAYGENSLVRRYFRGFFPVMFSDVKLPRMTYDNRLHRYRRAATSDAQSKQSYHYFPATGYRITYDKTALWLATLERYLGWETLQKIMSTFFERFKFKHPVPDDFFSIVNEVSARDMTWFFDQVYRSSDTFDYMVDSVFSSIAAPSGFIDEDGERTHARWRDDDHADEGEEIFRTHVVVRRNGGGLFPVEVLTVFEDGEMIRENWDGKDRWKLYVYERPSKIKYAAVDPDHKLLLDINYTNNSYLLKPASAFPARKWASKWMIWLQDLMATFAFFI